MRTEAISLIRCNCFEMWWPGTELNRRRQPFQGCALPPELPGHFLRATLSAHVHSNNDCRPIWPCTGRSHWAGCREAKQPMRWDRAELSHYNKAHRSLKMVVDGFRRV